MRTIKAIIYPIRNAIAGILGFEYGYQSDADKPSTDKFADRTKTLKFEGEIPAAEGFNTYASTRMKSVANFSGVKAPDGASINEKLLVDAKKSITTALALTDATKKARATFQAEMTAIKTYVAKKSAHPYNVIHYLYSVKDAAEKAIKEQQATEKAALTALFSDKTFTTNLDNSLTLNNDPDEINRIKNEMLAALDKSQTDELAAFSKSLNEPINQIVNIPTVQKTATLARYMENPETRNEIDELIQQAGGNPVRVSAGGEDRDPASDITDDQLKKLKTIRTRSGLKLSYDGENNRVSLKLPHRILGNPLYYLSGENNIKNDIKSLPEAIQRLGFKAITMDLNHDNQKYALKLAREAYAACRETGFDEKNIKIKVNGELMTADKIFAGHGALKQQIDLRAARYKADREKLNERSAMSTPEFKAKVMGIKETEYTPAAADVTTAEPTSITNS